MVSGATPLGCPYLFLRVLMPSDAGFGVETPSNTQSPRYWLQSLASVQDNSQRRGDQGRWCAAFPITIDVSIDTQHITLVTPENVWGWAVNSLGLIEGFCRVLIEALDRRGNCPHPGVQRHPWSAPTSPSLAEATADLEAELCF